MRGTIIQYEDNRGVISGEDVNNYEFVREDWLSGPEPRVGDDVDFIVEDLLAKKVFSMRIGSEHSQALTAIVSAVYGILGVHRFMVGKIGSGVVMLLLTITFYGLIITMVWNLIDFITIVRGKFTDKHGYVLNSEINKTKSLSL